MKESIELIIKRISEHWRNDPCNASLTISWLSTRCAWYVSICRYLEPLGKGKKIEWNVVRVELADAIRLCDEYMNHVSYLAHEQYTRNLHSASGLNDADEMKIQFKVDDANK